MILFSFLYLTEKMVEFVNLNKQVQGADSDKVSAEPNIEEQFISVIVVCEIDLLLLLYFVIMDEWQDIWILSWRYLFFLPVQEVPNFVVGLVEEMDFVFSLVEN